MSLVYSFAAAGCGAMAAWQVPYMLDGHPLNFVSFGFTLTMALYHLAKAVKA